MAIIAELRKSNPKVVILLAKLMPSVYIPKEDIEKYNTRLESLATDNYLDGSPIVMVDLYTDFNNNMSDLSSDSSDGVHTNQKGAKKNADKWFNALSPYLGHSDYSTYSTCSSFTYSSWSTCTDNIQSRTIVTKNPFGCTDGNPVLNQNCISSPMTVSSSSDSNARNQTNILPCASFDYSSWSTCSANGQQTRDTTSSSPANCVGGAVPVLSRSCTPPPDTTPTVEPDRGQATTNTITASPNPCLIPAGQSLCASTISWSTTGHPDASVWVSSAGFPYTLLGNIDSGSVNYPYITSSGATFDLRATNSQTATLLNSVFVQGETPVTIKNSKTANTATVVESKGFWQRFFEFFGI